MKENFIDKVYDTLQDTGPDDWHVPGVKPAFCDDQICHQLYGKVYDAKWRLCDRYYGGHEMEDVEEIISRMFDIMQEVGYQMYLYGAKFGIPEGTDTRTPAERSIDA